MSTSPHQIITTGEWDCALFTTYALSLSFFEAHLLRQGLKKNGCRDIWIVADAEGYAQSLAERQAMGVGQDYRLVPVGLPRGVFHPKCTYLHGALFDVLIVGSGNLTFGGHGNNVEVAETFRSDEHPEVFAQFAAFLRSLKSRTDFENPEPTWIDRFQELAARAGRLSGIHGDSVRLLHCVDQPICRQLEQACKSLGTVSGLRVLSPYFDPDAAGVRELVDRTKTPRAVIGLLEGQETKSMFPFGSDALQCRTEAALVELEHPNRPLHAKWFEVDLEKDVRLTLTGSVNATHQSLCTANNIEVGVLRRGSASNEPYLRWKRTKVPAVHVESHFQRDGLGSRRILQASLLETGQLEGLVLPVEGAGGRWQARLGRADGESVSFELEVGATGSFNVRISKPEFFDLAGGLQLVLQREKSMVRGWVHNEWLLDVARIRNVPVASILRSLRDEAEDEDDIAVLGFLTASMDRVMPALMSKRGSSPRISRDAAADLAMVPVDALAPGAANTERVTEGLEDRRVDRLGQLLQRLFGHYERSLALPALHPSGNAVVADEDEPDADTTDVDEDEYLVLERRREKAIVGFHNYVVGRLHHPAPAPQLRALCNAWLIVELQFRLRRNDAPETIEGFCRQWLMETARCCRFEGQGDELDERILAAAAILGSNAMLRSLTATVLVGLHEALENFGYADAVAEVEIRDAFLRQIRLPGTVDLADGLKAVLAARTRKQEIELLQQNLKAHGPLPEGLAVLETREGRALRDACVAGRWPKLIVIRKGATACPNCYMTLAPATLAELDRLRFSRCVQCGAFLARTED